MRIDSYTARYDINLVFACSREGIDYRLSNRPSSASNCNNAHFDLMK